MNITNSMVFARMPKKDVELVKKVSKARGEDLSDFVRRSIYKELATLSFLSNEQKKALGMTIDCQRE
jgi:hypothetical protein